MLTIEQCVDLVFAQFRELTHKREKNADSNLDRKIKGENYTMSTGTKQQSDKNINIVLHCIPPETCRPKSFHNHDYFELVYVFRGSFENVMPNNQFTLHQGDILLLNPNVMHSVFRRSEDDLVFNIMISKQLFQKYLANILEDNQMFSYFFSDYFYHDTKIERYLYFQNSDETGVKESIELMIREYFSEEPSSGSMVLSCLIALFARLSRNYQKENKIAAYENDRNRIMYEIVTFINANSCDVTLNQLAEHLQYSPGYLSKLLRKSGKSFSQLLLECRLNKATYYLKHTNLPISEIIKKVGYKNEFYFYKIFKENFHVTPSKYRKHGLTEPPKV